MTEYAAEYNWLMNSPNWGVAEVACCENIVARKDY
jgi:hypothetical protein